jgi:hypothetical protein
MSRNEDLRRRHLVWEGPRLRLHSNRGRVLATIEPDPDWPKMYRVRLPDGHVSDMANISWAKDAAASLALAVLRRAASHGEGPPVHFPGPAAMVARSRVTTALAHDPT